MDIVVTKSYDNDPLFTDTEDGFVFMIEYDYESGRYEQILTNRRYGCIYIATYSTKNRSKLEAIHNRAFTELKTMLGEKIYIFRKDYDMMDLDDFRTLARTVGDFCLKLEQEITVFDVVESKLKNIASNLYEICSSFE